MFLGVSPESLWKFVPPAREIPKRDWVLIKWTGSKRLQTTEILKHFPSQIATYYEPFLGGGAVLQELLNSTIDVRRFRCSDICRPLIGIWNLMKDDPRRLLRSYEIMWGEMQSEGTDYYYRVRDEFNRSEDPCEFFFLLRTCRNGLVRFNRLGQFTAAHDPRRMGIAPAKIGPVIAHWHEQLRGRDIRFTVASYEEIRTRRSDFVYLDPPYKQEKTTYWDQIDYEQFYRWLGGQRARYVLSLNGFVGDKDCRLDVPEWHFDEHKQVKAGRRQARDDQGNHVPLGVTHSLYVRQGN